MKVLVSGGFDPLHSGHVALFRDAEKFGSVIVALNSDEWLIKKKGFVFMRWIERANVLLSLKQVFDVVEVDDSDGTVCESLRRIKPDVFVNGGDRVEPNEKERQTCLELGIMEVFLAGGKKTQSSSELVKQVKGNT